MNAHGNRTPAPLSAQDIYRCLRHVAEVAGSLPRLALSPPERMALSGHLFLEGPQLVFTIAEAVAGERGLFRNAPLDPDELHGRQARVLALRSLQHLLFDMATRAGDLALLDQTEIAQQGMTLLLAVRDEAAGPFASSDARRTKRALLGAERVLRKRDERKERARRRATTALPRRRAPAPSAAEKARLERGLDALIMGWNPGT